MDNFIYIKLLVPTLRATCGPRAVCVFPPTKVSPPFRICHFGIFYHPTFVHRIENIHIELYLPVTNSRPSSISMIVRHLIIAKFVIEKSLTTFHGVIKCETCKIKSKRGIIFWLEVLILNSVLIELS